MRNYMACCLVDLYITEPSTGFLDSSDRSLEAASSSWCMLGFSVWFWVRDDDMILILILGWILVAFHITCLV